MSKKLMSIIVLSWNRLEYSRKTIECILKKTTLKHELILVDNLSAPDSGVKEYLSSVSGNKYTEDVIHVHNSKNLGVSQGRNSGLIKASPHSDVLMNIDDDILLPKDFDHLIYEACNKIPKLGITGVNVEKVKYPVVNLNGVRMQLKTQGNLGGAVLALPRRVFSRVGFYGFGKGTLYGHEDSMVRYKMDILGLLSAYIGPRGVHLDTDKRKGYRIAKNNAHGRNSIQLRELSKSVPEMRKTGNVYTPYINPKNYHPVDEDIFTNELIQEE